MTRKLKRPIAFLSAFAMVLTLLLYLPGSVMTDFGFGITASAYTEGYLRYDISEDEGCIYITEYFGREETVTVPSMIAGKPIYGINSNAFKNASSVKTIYLPETVGYIDDNAFNDSQTVMISVSINTDGNLEFSPLKLSTERNKPYSITISAVNGYSLPSSITVLDYTTELVQGTDYAYNSSTGELTVNAERVNTSLEIIAKGKKIEPATISFADYYATTDPLNPVILAKADVAATGMVNIPVSTIETDANYNYAYYWQYVEQDGTIVYSEEVDIDEYDDVDEDFNDITVKEFIKENAIAGMEYFVYVVRTGKLGSINYYVDGTYANNTLNLSPKRYNYGNDITYATVPAKEGYEFDGWYFESDYSGEKFTEQSLNDYKGKYDQYYILKVYGRYVQHTHAMTAVFEKAATCTEDGNRAYYKCTKCNKLFSDENGVTEITFDDVILPKLGHSFTNYVYNNDATCTGNGTETAECDNGCGKTDTREKADSALGHSFTNYVSNNDATCTGNGTETAKCDRCDIMQTREKANSALGHNFTNYVSNNDATCTENGTETAKCDRCNEPDTREEAGSALGHNFTNYVSNNNATCTENGTETAKCDRCDKTDTREATNSAPGHDHSGEWQKNDTEHWKVCARNGCTEILDKASHDYDNGVITTQPTEEKEGVKTYTCETCGHTKTEPVAKLEATIALPKATATPGENSVSLKWTAVDGAASYRVFYRVNGTTAWKTKNTTGTSVTISDLTGGTKYDFLVLAYDGTNWSKYTDSDIINATPKTAAPTAPAKPVFTVTAGENSVTVKWTAVDGAVSYRVFYRVNGTEAWTAKNTTTTSVTITGLTGGTKYDLLVRAYNGTEWSSYTDADIKTATPKAVAAPAAPAVASITPYENSVVIKWSASEGATSYRVFYRINGTTKWSFKNTTQTAMTLWELTGGKKYDFLVRAYNGKAWSAYTSQDIKNAVPAAATPKPSISSVTPGKNSVTVKWTAVDGASSYRVFYRVKGTSKWSTVNTTRTQSTISGLTGGKTYEILVRSYGTSGWSSYSPKDYAEAEING